MRGRHQPKTPFVHEKKDSSALALLQPWFLPKKIARQIMYLLPSGYKTRMLWMFEDYGCFLCARRGIYYGGNGFCRTCYCKFRVRMIDSMKRRLRTAPKPEPPKRKVRFIDSTALARELLSDLAPKQRGANEDWTAGLPGRKPRVGPNGPRPRARAIRR